ncbi:MAG: helix-turn-helix domain-containing protein [Candidatus Korarchaeota archaeon]|nr:helix-turn-helix domain-containing protein [Candidatus Korarchaeota archaeon]
MVKTLIPSVRALVAKELITRYNLRQIDVAKMLGVTQAAISQYLRGARGNMIDLRNDEEIMRIVNRIAIGLINKDLAKRDLSILICEICYQARKKGIYCKSGVRIQGKYAEAADLMCLEYDISREKGELKDVVGKLLRKDGEK